jgi:hypothetical protein
MLRRTLLLLLLTAASAHAAPPKACDLLSQSAAAQIFGGPLDPGQDVAGKGITCSFNRPHDEFILLQLNNVHNWGTNAPKLFPILAGIPQGGTGAAIPNLGEMNNFTTSEPDPYKRFDSVLNIYAQGFWIILTVRGSTNPHLKDAMIQAGRQMLPKL